MRRSGAARRSGMPGSTVSGLVSPTAQNSSTIAAARAYRLARIASRRSENVSSAAGEGFDASSASARNSRTDRRGSCSAELTRAASDRSPGALQMSQSLRPSAIAAAMSESAGDANSRPPFEARTRVGRMIPPSSRSVVTPRNGGPLTGRADQREHRTRSRPSTGAPTLGTRPSPSTSGVRPGWARANGGRGPPRLAVRPEPTGAGRAVESRPGAVPCIVVMSTINPGREQQDDDHQHGQPEPAP